MKLSVIAIVSWLIGLGRLLFPFFAFDVENGNGASLAPTRASLIASVLIFALLNIPGLYWLSRRGMSREKRLLYPPLYALIFNAPVFFVAIFLAGRTLRAPEAFLFIGTLVIVGIAFGLGFVWSYRDQVLTSTFVSAGDAPFIRRQG